MDDSVVHFVKDWLWAPLLGLVAWAWNRNEKEHEALRIKSEKLEEGMLTASSGLNDRIMEHIDVQISEVKTLVRDEDRKLSEEQLIARGHIAKLFEKIEETRKDTTAALASNAARAEDRHHEVLGVLREMTNSFHVALSQKADK